MWLLAATTDWSWLSYLGPFLPFGGLAGWALVHLDRELTRAQDRLAETTDQRFASVSKAIPVVEAATEAIRADTAMLDRLAVKLGETDQCLSECRAVLERVRFSLEDRGRELPR